MREDEKDYMPHGVTENEFLERLDPKELEDIQQNIVYSMIRRKTFDNARVLKKWQKNIVHFRKKKPLEQILSIRIKLCSMSLM